MSFDSAFELTIGHEGGYSNNPADPGGETKFGVSKRAYPTVDIRNLTLDQAKDIYRRDYWNPIKGDQLPEGVDEQVFDCAVHHGVRPAILMLQNALGVTADGIIGPQTLMAAHSFNPQRCSLLVNIARLELMTGLLTWPTFGRGWAKRVASNMKRVLA